MREPARGGTRGGGAAVSGLGSRARCGYRFFTQEAAAREGLGGFVCNLDDGRVEAQAEGEQAGLDRFERALHQGPPGSRVDRVAASMS